MASIEDYSTLGRTFGRHEIGALIERLINSGRTVLGPVRRDAAIVHDEISSVDDLPMGWTDEQSPGSYRLVPSDTDEMFAFTTPTESWKRYLSPPRTLIVRARKTDAGIAVDDIAPDIQPTAFFGVRSCDLVGIERLDRAMLDGAHPDPAYRARREATFIVAAACAKPGQTCFCASQDTGPSPRSSFDLAIAELGTQQPVEYLVTVGSPEGADMVEGLGRAATEADHDSAQTRHDGAVASMTRSIAPTDPALAANALEHPQWDDIAERCLACGNCTMVCPTCFCSTTEDTTSLDLQDAERWRVWDSCFTLGFTEMHGGSTRTSTASRYRQWMLHKLVTWHDQFDSSGCVGCGRCISWCPVGIDLTAEIAILAQSSTEAPT